MSHLPRKFVDDRTPISVKEFGALGDGFTDDSAAFTAALASGVVLYLPSGTYILGSKVTFTPDNTIIRGEVGSTIVKAADGSDYDYMFDISPGTGLTIENIEFDANQAGRGVTTNVKGGIRLNGATDLILHNIIARNTIGASGGAHAVGIVVAATRANISNTKVFNCGTDSFPSDGMYLSGEEIHVTDHLADTCTDHGLVFERANNCTAQGVVCLDCSGGIGISAFGNIDNYNVTVNGFVVKRVVSAGVNVGIDFGTFAAGYGELQNVTFANGFVDTRGNAGSNPAIAAFAGTGQAGILPTVHAITNVAATSPAQITSNGHGLSNGDTIEIFNVRGPTAVNARWSVTVINGNTFSIPISAISLPAYVSSTGYWQTQGRTRNVHLKNVHVLQDGATSLGAYIANVDNLTLEGCTINSLDANPVTLDGYCSNVKLSNNVLFSGNAHSIIVSSGTYRGQFDDNVIRGKDGTTVHGIFFFNTSNEVYARRNIVTGSSISGTGVNSEGITVISYTEVDLLSAQTVGGAKTWTADATFNGKVGMGTAPSGSVELSVKGGNSTATIDLASPVSGNWGMTFAGGLYGQITADLLSSNGLVISAFDNVRIGQAASFGLGGFTQIGRFDTTDGFTLSNGFIQSGGTFSLTGNDSSQLITTFGDITINGALGVKIQYNGAKRITAGASSIDMRLDGYDVINVYDGYTLINDQFGNTCMQIIPNAIFFNPGVQLWSIGPQVTLFGLIQFQREDVGDHDGADFIIQAQDGQTQDGGNDNTDGGDLKLIPGVQGFGGGGNDGTPGSIIITDDAATDNALIRIPHAQFFGYQGGKVLVSHGDGNMGSHTYISINDDDLHFGDSLNGDDLYLDLNAGKTFHVTINNQDALNISTTDINLKLDSGSTTVFEINSSKIEFGISPLQFKEYLTDVTIFQGNFVGTGANSGAPWTISAQDGQNQTGLTDNNNGGNLTLRAGSAGLGGGGADGLGGNVSIYAGFGTNTATDGMITLAIGVTTRLSVSKTITSHLSDNVSFFGGAGTGGGVGIFTIQDVSVAPSSNPSIGGFLYSELGAGKWRGSSGTITTFGPAEPHCEACGSDFTSEFESKKYGYLAICLKCLADELGDRKWIKRSKRQS